VVVEDGKPVYVYDDGKEVAVDAEQLFIKISQVNGEAKEHRLRAKAAEEKLAKLGDLDVDSVSQTLKELDTLGGLDAIKSGKKVDLDNVKAEITKAYEAKLAEKDKLIQDKDGHIYKLEVSNRFKSSKFINDRMILPPDIAEAMFGQNFKIEDGAVVATLNGNKLFSREKPGELADFEEAVQMLVEAYPMKDKILKGAGQSGSGATGGDGGHRGPGPKSLADCKTDAEKVAYLESLK
jgi:hypothetical protein